MSCWLFTVYWFSEDGELNDSFTLSSADKRGENLHYLNSGASAEVAFSIYNLLEFAKVPIFIFVKDHLPRCVLNQQLLQILAGMPWRTGH